MPQIGINNFLGRNLKSDPLDLGHHEAQTLDSFEISTKPGALVKRKGYTDQASVLLPASYPSNWTIVNFFQFRVTKPSAQDLFIVHATVGGEDRIYADYTHNGSSWVQGWVEITEREEDLTCDASTNTTSIVDAGLSSATNDYYNGWYVFNYSQGYGALVSDYDGGTKTLTLHTAVASQASGDTYGIYRFPLVVQMESIPTDEYTADTGSSTTQAFDYEDPDSVFYHLKMDFDDAYNGWIFWNVTRSDTQSVTDYEALYADNSRRITHAAITGQTDGDVCYVYDTTRDLSVDNKINFRQRPNICLMSQGSTARMVKQFPIWYGFLRETYYFGDTTNKINDGYYAEPQILDAPSDEIFTADTQTAGNIGITDTVYIACAYVYDGYQVGPMTGVRRAYEQRVASTDGSDDVRITFSVGYSAVPNMRFSRTLNKRVTGVMVYACTDLDTDAKTGTWHRVTSIPIREDFDILFSRGLEAQEESPLSTGSALANLRNHYTPGGRYARIKRKKTQIRDWSGSDPYARTFDIDATVWANKSDFYTFDSGGMGGDRVNYAYGADSQYHSIGANLFIDKQETSMIASTPLKDDGTPSPDWFPLLQLQDMAHHGIYNIYNIKIINDFVYIVGKSKTIRMLLGSGLVPRLKLEQEYEGLGTDATYSILKFKNSIFGLFNGGFYLLGGTEELLSYPIEDITNYPIGVSDITEGYSAFNPLRKEFLTVFPTDSKTYIFDIVRKQWAIHSTADALKALVQGTAGEIYAADASKIYRLDNGTTDDSTAINPTWKSKPYSLGSEQGMLNFVEISYKSDTVIQLDVYVDRAAAVSSWAASGDNQFAASTTPTTVKRKFPSNFRGTQFEFQITIPSGSRATNTYVEVYGLNIEIEPEERL